MEINKFTININPAMDVSPEDWYLGCIRDLVNELKKYEEVEVIGHERIEMLLNRIKEEKIASMDYYKRITLERSKNAGELTTQYADKIITYYDQRIDDIKNDIIRPYDTIQCNDTNTL